MTDTACQDCGMDTAPCTGQRGWRQWGPYCGQETPPCTGERGCRHEGRWEYYVVADQLWTAAGMAKDGGFLCIGCLERRIGRRLSSADFPPCPLNEPDPWDTPRLASRKGTT